jgi:hypothetical protein
LRRKTVVAAWRIVPGRAGQELGPLRRRRRDQRGLEQLADQAIGEVSF